MKILSGLSGRNFLLRSESLGVERYVLIDVGNIVVC
jgi:hypothetical protein